VSLHNDQSVYISHLKGHKVQKNIKGSSLLVEEWDFLTFFKVFWDLRSIDLAH
jgi:hypothetical protein